MFAALAEQSMMAALGITCHNLESARVCELKEEMHTRPIQKDRT